MAETDGARGALHIAVLGRKGGSAKTTTAYNLAGAFAATGNRCLLVDLDSQASLTRALSDDPVVAEPGSARASPRPSGASATPSARLAAGIDLAPGDRAIEATAAALAQNPAGPLRLRLLLEEVREIYDVVIIDTAPLLGFTQTSALLAGDIAVVPSGPAPSRTSTR